MRSRSGSVYTANAVPEDLLKSVAVLLQAYKDRKNPPPTAADLSCRLGHSEPDIEEECSLLKARGLVSISTTEDEPAASLFTITPAGTFALQEDGAAIRDGIVNALVWATTRVVKSDFDIDVEVSGGDVRQDEETTEDLSIFVGVSGDVEGVIYFGLDRYLARVILEIVLGRPAAGIGEHAFQILTSLADSIVDFVRPEFATAGFEVNMTPAVVIHPAGTKITTRGIPQVVVDLQSEHGPITVHVSLNEAIAI